MSGAGGTGPGGRTGRADAPEASTPLACVKDLPTGRVLMKMRETSHVAKEPATGRDK